MGRLKRKWSKLREEQGSSINTISENFCSGHKTEYFLPLEIIFEILSRLSVKTLLRCKCVCKCWCAIIEDRKFIEMHMNRSEIICEYTETNSTGDGEFTRLTVKHGLVVERSNITKKYHVRNPATKKILNLPDPCNKPKAVRMFFIPTINKYKLLYVHHMRGTKPGGCRVLTVGTDFTWRNIDIPCLYDLGSKRGQSYYSGTDDIFFQVRFYDGGVSEIVCIEAESEHYVNIKIPQVLFSSWADVKSFLWDNKLSLGGLVHEELHIWVLEDYKKQKWAERKTVISLSFVNKCPNWTRRPFPFEGRNGWLFFYCNEECYIMYHIESKRVQITNRAPPGKRFVYSLKHTLVRLEGISPKDKAKMQSPKCFLQWFCRIAMCFKE